jgi:HlyD family secretion protein
MKKFFGRLFSKKNRKWTLMVIGVLIAGYAGFRYFQSRKFAVPKGIAWGNGRIESRQVDVSAKLPLRVKQIYVAEGDLVQPGQVVAQMDTVTLDSQLAEAKAALAAAQEQLAAARAAIVKSKSQIHLAKIEKERSRHLVAERAGSQRDYDVRAMTLRNTKAGLSETRAGLQVAQKQVDEARANVATVQSRIDDATLKSPVQGRVLYRLVEPGEVLAAGGKALTLVNLEDIYMEIFLPSNQAAALKLGSEARFSADFAPNRTVAGYISFVSPEAQFTPKEVETRSEREKLMFRVRIQIPKELVTQFIDRIKTGVRGIGYVKVDPNVAWPKWMEKNVIRAPAPRPEAATSPPVMPVSVPVR